jgi:pimeloyl-ACP methyl ester carboxylesterase
MYTQPMNIAAQQVTRPLELSAAAFVTSADGTRIGYRQVGRGPGLVLVQGAMATAHNFAQLAMCLADRFTVTLPDRRGRGISPRPFSSSHRVQNDVDDLAAVLARTGARDVFGLSSGGAIALAAALALPDIHRVAIYEPPFMGGGAPKEENARFFREIDAGDVPAALVTAMRASGMGPPVFKLLPRVLLERMTRAMLGPDNAGEADGYASMRELAFALQYDLAVVTEMSERLESVRALRTEVLLLGGSRSPAFLKDSLNALERALPRSRRVELEGLGHEGPWNDDARPRGGRPRVVADALRSFFLRSS